METETEFDNILDKCLERILVRGETIEQCLAGYPEQAAELEPLLHTALSIKKTVTVEPRAEFRERARYQLHTVLREMKERRQRRFSFFSWQPRWVTALITVLILLLAGGGTVTAANVSMPDATLYPVKLATERVWLVLTPSEFDKAELYIKLADRRFAEISKMAQKGKVEEVERATQLLKSQLAAVVGLVGAPHGGSMLTTPEQPAPPRGAPTSPAAEPPEKETAVTEARTPPPESKGIDGKTGRKDRSGKPEKLTRLRTILIEKAATNPNALRALLDRVPASVKASVINAISVADDGYYEALVALN